jgi:predicted dehydrogenase
MRNNDALPRRGFIKGSLAAAGALLSIPSWAAASTAGRKLRIGIAGGRFGAMLQWHEHPGCIVGAVTDLHADRREHLMKTYRCAKSYPSLEEMVKDPNLDAIAVFTDGPKHFDHAVVAMAHGKHVVSAVPAVLAHSVSEGLDQAHRLFEKVKQTGLTYMLAETSYWQQRTISVRKLYQEGALGQIHCCESDYFHPGLKGGDLFGTAENPTWRYGIPPMFYPTHCTAHLISLTGERLVEVTCNGWGDDHPILKKNAYNNPFWNGTAHFRTNKGTPFRMRVWWEAPVWTTESASWFGTKMTITAAGDKWTASEQTGRDDAGFAHGKAIKTPLERTEWWKTDMLPEPLRHTSGHEGSHTFITHEFVDAMTHGRRPVVDIREALAYTVPGIIAHQSALKGGESLKIPQIG